MILLALAFASAGISKLLDLEAAGQALRAAAPAALLVVPAVVIALGRGRGSEAGAEPA